MKFTRTYEHEDTTETWTFDTDKFRNGPISVDIKYKNGADKKWGKMQKEAKQIKKTERQMKKINERNK
jgi:hypothetical protein